MAASSWYSSSYQKAAAAPIDAPSRAAQGQEEEDEEVGMIDDSYYSVCKYHFRKEVRRHLHTHNRRARWALFVVLVATTTTAAIFSGGRGSLVQESPSSNGIAISSSTSMTTSSIIQVEAGEDSQLLLLGSPNHYDRDRRMNILDALKDLQTSIKGTIYLPQEDSELFCEAAHVWSERTVATDRAPWAVIEVEDEEDVQKTVPVLAGLKRIYNFPFRVRSGGHNKAGFSTVSEGAVISLVRLNHISIVHHHSNATRREQRPSDALAKMGPGVLVEQFVEQVLAKHGYGGVVGFCGTVAEAGFILGGGIGLQSRLYGLGLDNVAGMRIVLADGSVHYVSNTIQDDTQKQQPTSNGFNRDLFWALRGAGGGSFGVVTEIDYHIHQANDRVLNYALSLQPDAMASFLYRLGEVESELPGNILVMHDLVDTVGILWSGRDESALEGSPDYLDSLIDALVPRATPRTIIRSEFLWTEMYTSYNFSTANTWASSCWYGFMLPEQNTEDIWQDIMEHISLGVKASSPYLLPDIELWGGAIHNTQWNETAFPYRSSVFNVGVLLTIPADAPNAEAVFHENVAKVNEWWPQVAKYLTGSYVNYPMASLVEQNYPRTYWGNNLEKLVSIKRRVDPYNYFQFPLSVPIDL